MTAGSHPAPKTTMDSALHMRRAGRHDLPRLRSLHALSLWTLGRSHYEPKVIDAFIRLGTMDVSMLDDGSYFVGEVDGELVACGGWSAGAPGYASLTPDSASPEPGAALVRAMYVHPRFGGQGLGRRMMRVIEDAIVAAGYGRAVLTASLMGVPFYLRLGYRAVSGATLNLPDDLRLVGVTMEKPALAAAERIAA